MRAVGGLPEQRHVLVLSDVSTYDQGVISVESDDDFVLGAILQHGESGMMSELVVEP
jgi:hypothetical protein